MHWKNLIRDLRNSFPFQEKKSFLLGRMRNAMTHDRREKALANYQRNPPLFNYLELKRTGFIAKYIFRKAKN